MCRLLEKDVTRTYLNVKIAGLEYKVRSTLWLQGERRSVTARHVFLSFLFPTLPLPIVLQIPPNGFQFHVERRDPLHGL